MQHLCIDNYDILQSLIDVETKIYFQYEYLAILERENINLERANNELRCLLSCEEALLNHIKKDKYEIRRICTECFNHIKSPNLLLNFNDEDIFYKRIYEQLYSYEEDSVPTTPSFDDAMYDLKLKIYEMFIYLVNTHINDFNLNKEALIGLRNKALYTYPRFKNDNIKPTMNINYKCFNYLMNSLLNNYKNLINNPELFEPYEYARINLLIISALVLTNNEEEINKYQSIIPNHVNIALNIINTKKRELK